MTGDQHRSSARPTQLFGYEILGRLGKGAGSDIYLASDPATSQVYALKHVIRTDASQTRIFEQLYNEYKVCRRLDHPVLRKCFTLRDKRALLWKVTEAVLLMELVDGSSMETAPPHDMAMIVDNFVQVAQGLAAMHATGMVHCDLKPNNILRLADGRIKIIDFGQACPTGAIKPRIQGTPDYIAPEQVRCEPVTARTDVFNFGATLYRVLTGRVVPTLFTTAGKTHSFVAADMVAAPVTIRHDVPSGLSSLVMECIRSQPSARPGGMHDLLYRLELIRHSMKEPSAAIVPPEVPAAHLAPPPTPPAHSPASPHPPTVS